MTGFVGTQPETVTLASDRDVVVVRRRVRERAAELDLDLVSQTKIVTAASELARNTVVYGLGGELTIDIVRSTDSSLQRSGLRLVFADHGPGIEDIDQAMTGGWTSGGGLGLGLPGSKRLVHEFELTSVSGQGTRIAVIIWRRS